MEPHELLEQVGSTYLNAKSYCDEGVVLNYLDEGEPPHEIAFRTWFVRPDSFRFDWRSPHPYPPLRHIVTNSTIRSHEGVTLVWSDRRESPRKKDLGLAIAGATGISHGAACDVPNLLMPQVVEAFQYRNLVHLHFVGMEEFESVSCYRIAGEHPAGGKHEIWIGTSDYLVRNFRTEFHSGHRADQIHRQIAVNRDIPPEVFALNIVVSEAPANSA